MQHCLDSITFYNYFNMNSQFAAGIGAKTVFESRYEGFHLLEVTGRPANVKHLEAGGADSHRPLPEPHKITVTFTGHVAHSTPSYHLDTRGTWVSPGAVSAMNE